MKIKISVKKIKNEVRPDLPWRWKVKHRGGTSGSCTDTEANAVIAACDVASRELMWWARLHERLKPDARS